MGAASWWGRGGGWGLGPGIVFVFGFVRGRAGRGLLGGRWGPAAVAGHCAASSAVRRHGRTVVWCGAGCGEVVYRGGSRLTKGWGGGWARLPGLDVGRDGREQVAELLILAPHLMWVGFEGRNGRRRGGESVVASMHTRAAAAVAAAAVGGRLRVGGVTFCSFSFSLSIML